MHLHSCTYLQLSHDLLVNLGSRKTAYDFFPKGAQKPCLYKISSPDSSADTVLISKPSGWPDSSGACLNIWPSPARSRRIQGGGGHSVSPMAAAESSGSAHSSSGHQWIPFADSDSDHPEPTHQPTRIHPADRWTSLRPGCRRDAGLIKLSSLLLCD